MLLYYSAKPENSRDPKKEIKIVPRGTISFFAGKHGLIAVLFHVEQDKTGVKVHDLYNEYFSGVL